MLFGENSLLFILQSFLKYPPGDIILWFVVFLFSLSFHESAHAWVSERFGDYTGRSQGRITLNPVAHIDPIGTLVIPLMGFMSGGISMFGWAKPVETNPLLWRDKTKANIMVSAAGPISNFILAALAFIVIKAMLISGVFTRPYVDDGLNARPALLSEAAPFKVILATSDATMMEALATLLSVFLILNVILGIFNLIPIPPLDGSHVLESLLPYEMAQAFAQIRPYGFILLLALIWTPVLGWILDPVYRVLEILLY
jgi:Zn-dependent protease